MIYINRQKFITELGKLLTFMYEEDRKTALDMYSDMFDDAADEQALIQYFVSPTRQAVVLARLYDAKERKLQVHTQSIGEGDASGVTPSFIEAVLKIREGAPLRAEEEELTPARQEEKGQISLFGEDDRGECADEPEEKGDVEQVADKIDNFLAGFSVPPLAAAPAEESAEEEEKTAPEAAEQETVQEPAAQDNSFVFGSPLPSLMEDQPVATKRVPRTALLILFIILAIPVGLLGLLLLLIPTVTCLSVAVGVVTLGVFAVSASFAGFSVIADVLLMLGAAVIILALGLLFAWLFIWFIVGPMVSLVKGIVALGDKWCYKEVEA